ncbi:DELLA protein GAI-like [Impatiens glandulifera]|uniref:DELLA protein GAI-like n=1 Tax=Impatiens glandulifera TaxID=253017 RepID=UPI001FB07011|nr:DELLA protein GAI-like [Impatiens glandulifera]
MGPYGSCTSGGSSSGSSSSNNIDGMLAGTGYKVRSSELRHVAQRLEYLETAMVNAPSSELSHIADDTVIYNPSDLGSWVDSLLSELPQSVPVPDNNLPNFPDLDDYNLVVGPAANQTVDTDPNLNPWAAAVHHMEGQHSGNSQQQLSGVTAVEEDSGIRIVHLLMSCAETIQRGEFTLAATLVEEMQDLLTRVNTDCGIGKVAGYFIDALSQRIFSPPQPVSSVASVYENEILYRHFYEACPYLKFAHFTANQAILEAFHGHDCVHVVDFNLMEGLQWPALIQALALRPGGPPLLRLTGIGPPSPDGRDSLREIGLRLAELARSVNVRFAFRGVAASRLEDVKPWMLQVNPKEAIAVNSIMQFHRLLATDPTRPAPMDSVLKWIKTLNPKIVTVVEQEVDHNQPEFLERFMEALYYYSTMFDSLEVCSIQPEKALAEMYIQKQIYNVVCCEGSGRVERHETLDKWRARFGQAGFHPVHLGSNAYKQASMLLTLFSAEGYSVEENDGCLTLGWHNRPLIAASAWHAGSNLDHSVGSI